MTVVPRRMTLKHLASIGAASMLAVATIPAVAQTQKPLTLVIGLPAGGTLDVLTRPLAEGLREKLKRTVLIENRPGAGGMIAAEKVKTGPKDGTSLLVTPTAFFSLYPHTLEKFTYRSEDFLPVAHLGTFEYGYGVGPALNVSDAQAYVKLVKADSQKAMFGAAGMGGPPQFYGRIFSAHFDLGMTVVPYPGTPPIAQDLQGGVLPAAVMPIADWSKLKEFGKLKVLAVTGNQRSPDFPEAPTFKELGMKGADSGHFAFYAPAGTPVEAIEPVAKALNELLSSADIKSRYAQMHVEPTGFIGEELRKSLEENHKAWNAVAAQP